MKIDVSHTGHRVGSQIDHYHHQSSGSQDGKQDVCRDEKLNFFSQKQHFCTILFSIFQFVSNIGTALLIFSIYIFTESLNLSYI